MLTVATGKHPFCPNRGGGVYNLCKLVSVEEIAGGGSFCVFLESLVQTPQCFVPFINIAAASVPNDSQPQIQQAFVPTAGH